MVSMPLSRQSLPSSPKGWLFTLWIWVAPATSLGLGSAVWAQSTSPLFPLPESSPMPLTTPLFPPPVTRPFAVPLSPSTSLSTESVQGVSSFPGDLNRAKNLARQAAEIANGGLQNYQAEASMHGPSSEAPVMEQETYWLFTFRGGSPGFRQPTIESEVQVDKDTFETRVMYNGPLRP